MYKNILFIVTIAAASFSSRPAVAAQFVSPDPKQTDWINTQDLGNGRTRFEVCTRKKPTCRILGSVDGYTADQLQSRALMQTLNAVGTGTGVVGGAAAVAWVASDFVAVVLWAQRVAPALAYKISSGVLIGGTAAGASLLSNVEVLDFPSKWRASKMLKNGRVDETFTIKGSMKDATKQLESALNKIPRDVHASDRRVASNSEKRIPNSSALPANAMSDLYISKAAR